ncbi:hypothetical protein C0J52_28132 [Blattella germanica]|nr:hypothetical protein C0J52_28132 [Blattella germanica]
MYYSSHRTICKYRTVPPEDYWMVFWNVEVSDDRLDNDEDLHLHKPSKVDRVKRDVGDVTTVLLVDNTGRHRDGRFNKKAVGLLTSTARTFVQEGTTTEFATQVVGTTLDNGRLYAQVVTTSSRVFFHGENGGRDKTRTKLDELVLPSIPLVADIARPTQPIQDYPSQTEDSVIKVEPFSYAKSGNIYQTAVNEHHTPISRYIGEQHHRANGEVIRVSSIDSESSKEVPETQDEEVRDELEALFLQAKAIKHNRFFPPAKENESEESENLVKAKRMDYFKKRNTGDTENQNSEINDVNPAKVVRPVDGLPTFTIRHDFAPSGFSVDDNYEDSTESRNLETSPKGNRFRTGKSFFRNRVEQRKLDTVTYLGFSDFTTTVGDTVIVFMPHTSAGADGHQGRKATSIAGDATLAPELQHPNTELPVSVVTSVKTFMSHTPGMVTRTVTGHSLSMQTALPTMVVLPETTSYHPSVHSLPQSVTIRRDHKALQSAQVLESITTQPPTDFEDVALYLANEQLGMAEKTTPTEEIVTEPIPDSETIEPSSVSYNDHIESSIEEPVQSSPAESSTDYITTQTTDSLGYFSTAQTQLFDNGGVENPLGLIKVVGGTEALNGTTTLFTSLVYGTNINGNYAQIIHSTSSKFYFVDNTKVIITDVKAAIQPTAVLDTPSSSSTTTPSPPITTQKDEEVSDGTTPPPTTFSQAVDSTNEQPETTTESNSITTVQLSTTDDDTKHTTKLDETLTTVPMDETTTESDSDSFNEVETGRKISSKPKDQVIVDTTDGKNANGVEKSEDGNKAYSKQTIFISTSNNFVTQLVPSTVYKTFTYLTTFFIPAEGTSTTTSIRSREVTSSEISYSTRIFNPNVQTSIDSSVIIQSNVETYSNIAITPTVSSPQEENLQTTTPGDNTIGTTNVDEPVEHTTVTTPELPEEKTTITSEDTKITTISPKPSIEGEEDEIELIFKTLYTTYTYLTTFFQESTTSVSSREVVVTNVVTSTVDKSYILHASDPAVAGLFARDDVLVSSSIQPLPTSVGIGRPTTKYYPDVGTNPDEDLFSSVIESVDLEKELATPTPVLNNLDSSKSDDNELKTFFTTYTYFTTILVDGETEVESRTEIYTNIVTPSGMINPTATRIEPTISLREPLFENSEPSILSQIESPQFQSVEIIAQDSSHIRTPILKSTPQYSYSSTISRAHKSTTEEIESSSISSYPASAVNTPDVDDEENSIFPKNTPKFESSYATISRPRNSEFSPTVSQTDLSSKSPIASREVDNDKGISSAALTSSPVSEIPVVVETMSTDVTSSSSDGGRVMMLEKRNDKHPLLDDQISSESNTEALEPSPTLLLQTSFTTFTYFTTVYRGSTSSDIISRLETITNVVTETLTPSASPTISVPPEDASLPITYFTTFTYWTTLYKDSSTVVTSREETVSNVVTPTVNAATSIVLPITITPSSSSPAIIVTPTSVLNEPTTFYTTYTYFTTSYVGNSTVLSSRLETVTNIVNSSSDDATGRAVGSGATLQKLPTETIKPETSVQPSTAVQPTGLLSTILTSKINNGTTTLFSTDVYGTFIDGLYAQVLESSTQVVTPPLVSPTKVQIDLKPTGIVSLNEGKIVDAMGVSTTFFTTKAIGTYIDALYAEVVESTTSVYINTERQSIIEQLNPTTTESVKSPRTGLVRIVEGSIVKDQTTTYYESKVSGTIIDGRYAQIIESTSSFKVAVAPSIPSTSLNEIAPTSTVSPDIFVTPTVSSSTSPTPAVIESSLSDDGASRDEDESGDDEDSDENDGKKSKKSRLSYPARKRTFTPVIRPFSSRNRPSFNPKRKTPIGSSATTITRTSVTPTVTATPAGKTESGARNRFNTRRGSSSGVYKTNYNDIRATPTGTGGRRTTRRGSSSSGTSTSTPYSGRGRGAASGSTRLYATSTPGQPAASRRGAFYRSSSGRQAGTSDFRGSTSGIHHGASSSRFRIRPTQSSLIGRGGNTAYTTPSSDETLEPDDDVTTVITEETPRFTDDEQDSQTQPVSTTTESPRRSSNPLLRFRRPPTLRTPQTTSTTPKPTTTQSSRRSPLLRRPANERGSTTQRPRTSTRYNPLLSRQRTNNSLFPPRGLLKKPGKDEEEETKKEEEEDHNEEEHDQEEGGEEQEEDDFDDNDYEGSETSESKTKPNKSANRRSSKAYNPVNIRPFVGFNRKPRTKRQAEYGSKSGSSSSRSFTPRYRRPTSGTSRSQQESSEEQESSQEVAKPKQTNSARFTPRPRSSVTTQPRVRPTTASSNTGRSQFTLRKDDSTTSNRANFKRPTTPSPRRRTNSKPTEPPSAQRPKPPRLKSQSTSRQTDATTFTRSNSARRNPNTSRRGSTRSRYRETDYDTYTYSQTSFDGSITVTHHIPTEVTIPIVNGRVTEYRNVITASPSTEVLGPHQYTVSTAKGGNTMLYLTSEVTGTLPSGATEITQFVIHETPTTSVIFTPTVIRGHKTSYSHIIPSTVYDVEQVVNTLQPQITPNAPLANILLSQLLLGNFGVQPNLNPLLALNNPGPPPTPTTEFKTRQTTYVTTVTKGTSTVLPLTFRGKEILTTIVDSSTEVITATEFITDTIVVTPTASNNQLNSLLLPALLQAQLLGQPQPQPMVPNPLLAGLQQQFLQQDQKPIQDTSFEDLLTDRPPRRRQRPVEEPDRLVRDSDKEILDDDAVQNVKGEDNIRERTGAFKNSRKKSRIDKKPPDPPPVPAETSVVTLYVSGRRPGEFSTVISTVTLGEESSVAIRKREAGFAEPEMFTVSASQVPEIGGSFPTSDDDNGYLDHYVMSAMNEVSGQDSEVETQSLESIVGDVSTYVSSVIGQSSSSSKLGLSKPSLTEKLSSLSTDNKKKHYNKKNIASSSFNSTSFAGHFLSKGPAESAPLKRKVIITQNRGNDDNSSFLKQYSTIETKTQNYNTSESSEQIEDNIDVEETFSSRTKRSTENTSDTPVQRRRRVRVRVPVDKKKITDDLSLSNSEILTVSEAQHRDTIPDMDIAQRNFDKAEQGKQFPQLEYGSRRIKIVRGRKPSSFDANDDNSEHSHKRVIVTRRRRPEFLTANDNIEDAFTPLTDLDVADIQPTIDDFLPITTYHPKEIPVFISSNMVGEDDRDLYVLPTTVRGENIVKTTPGRRRVVVTKKRPVAITPTTTTHRRRVIVTKKRPVPKVEIEIEPTNVIPEPMSTIYSYKYTVLNRENGLNTDDEKVVKVSQVYMSGKIPIENNENDYKVNNENTHEDENTPTDNTNRAYENPETELRSHITPSESVVESNPTSVIPVDISTSNHLSIQASQIESSLQSSSFNLNSETPGIKDLTKEVLDSGEIPTVSPIHPIEASTADPEDATEAIATKTDMEDEPTVDEEEGNEETEDSHDHDNEETLISSEKSVSHVTSSDENTFDGPRFIRPTRFSITRKPGNTKTSFPGKRRSSTTLPSVSSSIQSSFRSSSSKYRSSYRGRKPSSSTRGFGRSSKSNIHLLTTPTSDTIEPTSVYFEDILSSSLTISSSNVFESSVKLSEDSFILYDSSYGSDEISSSLPEPSSTFSDVSSFIGSTLPEPASDRSPDTPILESILSSPTIEPIISSTIVTEVITSTRLRTYTYIVTRVAGEEQVVTSTTEVKPRVTTLTVTKTLPILATGEFLLFFSFPISSILYMFLFLFCLYFSYTDKFCVWIDNCILITLF